MSILTDLAARLETLLVQRLGDAAPDPEIVGSSPLSASAEAVVALRAAATGMLDEFDLATLSETLDALAAAASLDDADRHVLTLLALCNLDDRIGRAIGLLHDDVSRTRPSIGLIARVLEPFVTRAAALDAAALDGTLVQRGMIEHTGAYADADAPVANRELILHPRVQSVITSGGPLSAPEPRLASALLLERTVSLDHPESADDLLDGIEPDTLLYRLSALPRTGRAVGLLCVGPDLEHTLDIAREFAQRERLRLLRIDMNGALALGETPESLVRLVRRESIVLHALPVWTGLPSRDALADPQLARRVAHLFTTAPAPLLIHAEHVWTPPADLPLTLVPEITPALTYSDRVALWQHDDGKTQPADAPTAQQLATSFVLPPTSVQAARADAEASTHLFGGEFSEQLLRAAHRQAAARLVRFATKITPRAKWSDIVVPPSVRQQLHEVETRVTHRLQLLERFRGQLGFVTLFAGASGTGKTLAAEIIAGQQGSDLFTVDLASVVSKYIGDTEKNLEQIFQDAESSHAILFFDEADAVFGKRSEVRDSHDHYANQQVNYLLKRLDTYNGIIILATNLRQNMDEAFLRRMHLVVELPFPDEAARADIWQRVWPSGIAIASNVDFQDLGHRFRMAGGSIRNAAVDSAFRAVSRGGSEGDIYIEREDIILAIGREYQKLGRPITRGDFLDDYALVTETLFAPIGEVANA